MKFLINNIVSSTAIMAAKFTSGNVLVAIIGAISTLLYGKWIGPEVLGEFNKYGILTTYLCFGIVFVDAAFQRNFQYFLGKSQKEKALEIAEVALWWFLALFLLGGLIFAILAGYSYFLNDFKSFWGWSAQILAFGVMTYGLFLSTLYRTNNDFLKMNRNLISVAGAGVITLPLVYYLNFFGFAYRNIIQNLINLVMFRQYAPFKVKPKFDKKILINLFKISLPLQLPVYLDTILLKASLGLIILKLFGEESLGVYAMAITLSGFLMIFSRSLNQIISTKIMLKYGSNDSVKETFNYIKKPVFYITLLGVLLVFIFVIAIKPAILFFLPKYIDSILIAQVLAVELILSLIKSPFTLFISSLMYKTLFIQRVIKVIITFLLLYFFHNTLLEIAIVIVFANFLNVIYGYCIMYSVLNK